MSAFDARFGSDRTRLRGTSSIAIAISDGEGAPDLDAGTGIRRDKAMDQLTRAVELFAEVGTGGLESAIWKTTPW